MYQTEKYLFIVVLGGKKKESNIELHDVRWVAGKYIEETFSQLRKEWFGDIDGLHIDSYLKVNFIDGYLIKLQDPSEYKPANKSNKIIGKKNDNCLWFINLGGYNPLEMYEQHQFGLVVAKSSKEAQLKAKRNWLYNTTKKHTDNISKIKSNKGIDNCILIEQVNELKVELFPDKYKRCQSMKPDWYGYMKIDKG